jgi:hypothetical protein
MWSVQDSLSGDNLIYHIEEPQYLQLIVQGKVKLNIFTLQAHYLTCQTA